VSNPPKTAEQLLAWAKANPGKFLYARPANSGPGRSILAGMPYILKDKDPKDPEKGWDKTWAFLKELGQTMDYYPTGTGFTLKEFAQDQRWMIAGIMEWDMKPRAEGIIPPECRSPSRQHDLGIERHKRIPKGVSPAELEVILDLMRFMRRPEQQVLTWRAFIGPSIKAATLDKAPPDLQKYVKEIWRPEYDEIGKKWKVTPMLEAKKLNYAIERWDKEVGAQKIKKQ
jgi:putative spermidine/putrescine transport system substrate-binding protein